MLGLPYRFSWTRLVRNETIESCASDGVLCSFCSNEIVCHLLKKIFVYDLNRSTCFWLRIFRASTLRNSIGHWAQGSRAMRVCVISAMRQTQSVVAICWMATSARSYQPTNSIRRIAIHANRFSYENQLDGIDHNWLTHCAANETT